MNNTQQISPSPQARNLFNKMVSISVQYETSNVIHLPLEKTLELAVKRFTDDKRHDREEVRELVAEGWITPHGDGGWVLN